MAPKLLPKTDKTDQKAKVNKKNLSKKPKKT